MAAYFIRFGRKENEMETLNEFLSRRLNESLDGDGETEKIWDVVWKRKDDYEESETFETEEAARARYEQLLEDDCEYVILREIETDYDTINEIDVLEQRLNEECESGDCEKEAVEEGKIFREKGEPLKKGSLDESLKEMNKIEIADETVGVLPAGDALALKAKDENEKLAEEAEKEAEKAKDEYKKGEDERVKKAAEELNDIIHLKTRKELAAKITEAKEKGMRFKVTKSLEEGYRYDLEVAKMTEDANSTLKDKEFNELTEAKGDNREDKIIRLKKALGIFDDEQEKLTEADAEAISNENADEEELASEKTESYYACLNRYFATVHKAETEEDYEKELEGQKHDGELTPEEEIVKIVKKTDGEDDEVVWEKDEDSYKYAHFKGDELAKDLLEWIRMELGRVDTAKLIKFLSERAGYDESSVKKIIDDEDAGLIEK